MYVLIIHHSGSSSLANDLSFFFHIYYAFYLSHIWQIFSSFIINISIISTPNTGETWKIVSFLSQRHQPYPKPFPGIV